MASFVVLNETIDSLNAEYNMRIRTIECTGLEEIEEPWDPQDKDLYRVLNIYRGQLDEAYYFPEEFTIITGNDESPNLFIQGGKVLRINWQSILWQWRGLVLQPML